MNNVFLDTEFLETETSLYLISLALVEEGGDEFYAVNAEMPLWRVVHHEWLSEHVFPYLPRNWYGGLDVESPYVIPMKELTQGIENFFNKFSTRDRRNTRIWAWCGSYDFVIFQRLWGFSNMPPNVPRYFCELKQLWIDSGEPEKPSNEYPHHALFDARWNYATWRFLTSNENENDLGFSEPGSQTLPKYRDTR